MLKKCKLKKSGLIKKLKMIKKIWSFRPSGHKALSNFIQFLSATAQPWIFAAQPYPASRWLKLNGSGVYA
jgi:hypothetical protein